MVFSKASRRNWRQSRARRLLEPIEVSIKRTAALTATAIASYTAAVFLPIRNLVPEPFDALDHASNTMISPVLAASSAAVFSDLVSKEPMVGNEWIRPITRKDRGQYRRQVMPWLMAAAGLGMAFVETRFGLSPSLIKQPQAYLDVAYAVASTAVAGELIWRKAEPRTPTQGTKPPKR